jgi:hypothetical protein
MAFWTTAAGRDPKRKFRFLLNIANLPEGGQWFVKTSDRPSITVAPTEHKFLNHTFYYPGSVTWNEVAVSLVDPVDPDMQYALADILRGSGYYIPVNASGPSRNTTTMSKSKAAAALGSVMISLIDSDGNPIESWLLNGAWISSIENSNLEYGSDDLSETTVKFKYDWATLLAEEASPQYDKSTAAISPEDVGVSNTTFGGQTIPDNNT